MKASKFPVLAAESVCTGCAACSAVCRVGAVSMLPDAEGFLRPVINAHSCVHCGMCERACPVINMRDTRFPIKCFAAKTHDSELLRKSSSGGVFTELAIWVLNRGGCVFGCILDCKAFKVYHCKAETIEDIEAMRGSKYVQSDLRNVLQEARRELDAGRLVMFTGTPCQISGLRGFLGREYPNLLCVGLICHGVPSTRLFEKLVAEAKGRTNSKLIGITFRSKFFSWHRFAVGFEYADASNNHYVEQRRSDYMIIFNSDAAHRPSCYNCKAHAGRCGSDVLIGDFWGVHEIKPDLFDDRGISVVLAYTKKALDVIAGIQIVKEEVAFDDVARFNRNIQEDAVRPKYRKLFYRHSKKHDLAWLKTRIGQEPFWKRALRPTYCMLRKVCLCFR